MCLRLVCSCLCVFEGEKRGSGEIACFFFLAGSCLLGHSSRNHKVTNFPASLSFFPTHYLCGSCFPRDSGPLGQRRRDMGGVTDICRNTLGTFCLSYQNICLDVGFEFGSVISIQFQSLRHFHQTLPPLRFASQAGRKQS